MYEEIQTQLKSCVRFLAQTAQLQLGRVIVLGCSTSEVAGGKIGKNSVPELGDALASAMLDVCAELGLHPVFQCCEHLNRALVMEEDTLQRLGLKQVNAMPVPKAGGSTAAAAYLHMRHPVLAECIQADAAVDVGDTLVGMHIRPVAVPVHMDGARVGAANVVMAFSRLPYIGGERTQYPPRN